MSHQWHEGWFPLCIACGANQLEGAVCLDPTCHEQHGLKPIELKPSVYVRGDLVIDIKLIEENEHWWLCCQICDRRMQADGGAWGSYALCINCFNDYINRGKYPPNDFWEIQREKCNE
jgi:hypothetical protein